MVDKSIDTGFRSKKLVISKNSYYIETKKPFFNLRKLKQKIHQTEHGSIDFKTAQGIANDLNISTSDVIKMDSRISQNDSSLNHKINDESQSEFMELIER